MIFFMLSDRVKEVACETQGGSQRVVVGWGELFTPTEGSRKKVFVSPGGLRGQPV